MAAAQPRAAIRPRRDRSPSSGRASARSPSCYRSCSSVTPGTATSRRSSTLATAGVPRRVAATAAGLGPMGAALDVVEVARRCGHAIEAVAAVYLALGERLHLDRLRDRVNALPRLDRWQTGARSALRDELAAERRGAHRATCSRARPERLPPSRSSSGLRRNTVALDALRRGDRRDRGGFELRPDNAFGRRARAPRATDARPRLTGGAHRCAIL